MIGGKRRRPPWLAAIGTALVAIGVASGNLLLVVSGVAFGVSYLLGWPSKR